MEQQEERDCRHEARSLARHEATRESLEQDLYHLSNEIQMDHEAEDVSVLSSPETPEQFHLNPRSTGQLNVAKMVVPAEKRVTLSQCDLQKLYTHATTGL